MTNVIQESARLRNAGFNIIPIRPGTKVARAEPGDVMKWKMEGCKVEIKSDDSIAMLHSENSGTWALDLDDPGILNELVLEVSKRRKLMVVKTPKQGHHIIWGGTGKQRPPKDVSLSRGKQKIDVKGNGYTLLPPSIHPDKSLGNYQWLNDTIKKIDMSWELVEEQLNKIGFFSTDQTKDTDSNLTKHDYGALVAGGFKRGSRRTKLYSLYHKKRAMGSSHADTCKECKRVAGTCIPPVPDNEFESYMIIAEKFYKNKVEPSLGLKNADTSVPHEKKTKSTIDHYALANVLMERNKYLSHRSKEIYVKVDGAYRDGGHLVIRKNCRDLWESIKIKSHDVIEVENIIKEKTIYDPDDGLFDSHPHRLILLNGEYDIDNEQFIEEWRDDTISIIKHNVKFDPDAKCPRWDKFLESALPVERDRGMIYEMMALCFIRLNLVQKGYVLHGIGHNGKSTVCNILRNMLGARNTCSLPMNALQGKDFSGWEIYGKSANISGDGGTEPIRHTTFLKKLLGGDAVKCEGKYRDPFDFVSTCSMIFVHNELPSINDSSDGFARKMQTVHFAKQFYGSKRDRSVDRIKDDVGELSGIFNKLLPIICRIYRDRNLEYEDDVKVIKDLWLKRSDSVYRFISEYLVLNPGGHLTIKDCKMAYLNMCSELGMTSQTDGILSEKMTDKFGKSKHTRTKEGTQRAWQGVGLKSEVES